MQDSTYGRSPRPYPGANPSYQDVPPSSSATRAARGSQQPANGMRSNGSTMASPERPVRSRMREQLRPISGERSRPTIPAIQPRSDRRPSAIESNDIHESGLSPISPSQSGNALDRNNSFSDPFAYDRSQRSELRAHAAAKPTAFQGVNDPSNKLRSAVGAFMKAGKSQDSVPAVKRPAKSRARQARPDPTWELSSNGKFAEMDTVLKLIHREYPFILDSDFSPVALALSLLGSDDAVDLNSFLQVHDALSNALQKAVQAHFQTFASSLPAHATFLSTLDRAQQQVKASKAGLLESRKGLSGSGKTELASIKARERTMRDVLSMLDSIDQVRRVPDQLESLIGDRQYLSAAVLLMRSKKILYKSDLESIGGLSDLKAYFDNEETVLFDILVEELHKVMYLRRHGSEQRLNGISLLAEGQRNSIASVSALQPDIATTSGESNRFSLYLSNLALRPNQDPMINAETETVTQIEKISQNDADVDYQEITESKGVSVGDDEFTMIESVLEALGVLGKLRNAVETATQRGAAELHVLVDSTIDEIEESAEEEEQMAPRDISGEPDRDILDASGAVASQLLYPRTGQPYTGLVGLSSSGNTTLLRELFQTIYLKFAAVLEAYRVIYEVCRWISARQDFRQDSKRSAKPAQVAVAELWRPMQEEIRMLLTSYITEEGAATDRNRGHFVAINEVLKDNRLGRDRNKQLYQFSQPDAKITSQEAKLIGDALQNTLKLSVPGLLNTQVNGDGGGQQLGSGSQDDQVASHGAHRTLISPNCFNVTTLFEPTLLFIERACAVMPPEFQDEPRNIGAILEDFVNKDFLPQLDERVTSSFNQAVSGHDAYETAVMPDLPKPPMNSSARVLHLIHGLCFMLDDTPFHRENYSRLIVGVIVQYYQQCSTRFKDIVTLGPSLPDQATGNLALPAIWAQRQDVIDCLTELRAVKASALEERNLIAQKEIKLETELAGGQPPVEAQLISSLRKLEALSQLAQSLRWFIDSLLDLQDVKEDDGPSGPQGRRREEAVPVIQSSARQPRLPLTQAMAQRFEAIIQTFEQLAEMVVNTIRVELRCKVMCHVGATLKKDNFELESQAFEPDPDIVDLAKSVSTSEEIITRIMGEQDAIFVFRCFGDLFDHLFVSSARKLGNVNLAGVQKMKQNIMALQQVLRSFDLAETDDLLTRSMAFWDMYESGPKMMLEQLRTSKPLFSFEDYNTLLNLQCKSSPGEAPSAELNTYLIDLHALSMSIEGWEIGGDD